MFRDAEEITPDDNEDLERPTQGIYVGGAGNITVHMARADDADPDEITFNNVSAGTILPIWVRRVKATGTTATNLLALRA